MFIAMATQTEDPQNPRTLLGLRPPAELAEGPVLAKPAAAGRAMPAAATPARPDYPIISSGRDDEDTGPTSKTSDLMTAILAGGVLLLVLVGLGMLLS